MLELINNMVLEDSYRHKGMRKKLVEELQAKGIQDIAVLRAINTVPRHFFFEKAFLEHAYEDKAFPIGEGQTISQPYTVAFQSQLLEIKPGDKVLEIGTGSGYQASILCELQANVFSVEVIASLHYSAKKMLDALKYSSHLVIGDGTLGFTQHAPYDKIIVTAGAPMVPDSLIDQLKIGGILVIPVGQDKTQKMVRIRKISGNTLEKEEFGDFSFVPLKGEKGWR